MGTFLNDYCRLLNDSNMEMFFNDCLLLKDSNAGMLLNDECLLLTDFYLERLIFDSLLAKDCMGHCINGLLLKD